ncbi:metallophosphoesterase family protein, partial [Deinococcus pimensis]|uniref:metallophosphoesterase family protein n=1 Tax=Deinococcus pimensis TaxID=309888 RepID=UPI0005EB96E0
MRLLLLSDVHANLAALEAVLADARARGFDRAVFLGDALGYGPQPAEVLAL